MKERNIGIVTGGASGLGLATVKRLATKLPIAIVDIAEEKCKIHAYSRQHHYKKEECKCQVFQKNSMN